MKRNRFRLIFSIICLFIGLCTFVGSTFAWFTDSVSNTGNRIQAGTLDIGLEQYLDGEWVDISDQEGKDKTPVFAYDKWEPGYSDIAVLKITNNESSLTLKYRLFLEVNDISLYLSSTNITDVIDVYMAVVDKDTAEAALTTIDSFNDVKTNLNYVGTAKEILCSNDNYNWLSDGVDYDETKDGIIHGVILPKNSDATGIKDAIIEETYAIVALHMQEDADNKYQGLSQMFDICLYAGQYTYEKDGFSSNGYDEDAKYGFEFTCLNEGTEITLANGNKKLIEDINYDDELLTWNFFTGQLESHKCYLIVEHNNVDSTLISLSFDNGKKLDVIDGQCIFDLDLNEYAYISKNCVASYLNDNMMFVDDGQVCSTKLVDYSIETCKTNSYELCTQRAINFIANGLVTIEPESYGFNCFEIDQNLKITDESVAELIAEYGLYTYDDFPELTHETFDAIGVKYFKIIIEYTGSDVDYLREYYKEHNIR